MTRAAFGHSGWHLAHAGNVVSNDGPCINIPRTLTSGHGTGEAWIIVLKDMAATMAEAMKVVFIVCCSVVC
jgi:hypothetical protein